MRLRSTILVLAVVPALAIPSLASAGPPRLTTDLTGLEEVPPGDFDATGFADLNLHKGKGTVCFELSWADVDGTVTAAHIHQAPAGENGPVVVGLLGGGAVPPGTTTGSGCVDASRELITAIRKNPTDYYVNVHSTVYPAGAIRGQLGD
jgi:hypothetical protein